MPVVRRSCPPTPTPAPTLPRAQASLVEVQAFGMPVRLLTARYGQHCYQPHLHEECTLSVIEQGDLRFASSGRAHHARCGEVEVIPPLAVHDGRNGGPQGFSYRVLYLHPHSLRAALGRDDLPLFEGVRSDARCAAALRLGHQVLGDWVGSRLGAEEALLGLLDALVPGLPHGPAAAVSAACKTPGRWTAPLCDQPAVRRVAQRLDDRPQDNPCLDELALEAGLSRRHLTRLFRAGFGLSVHQYQMQAKVRTAYSRLRAGSTVAGVAADLGFADQAHLTRWFWSVCGVSPGQALRSRSCRPAPAPAPDRPARAFSECAGARAARACAATACAVPASATPG